MIITVDGPAGSGKSTVTRLLAETLHLLYLDTGAMYRAVALQAGREGVGPDDARGLGALCRDMGLRLEQDAGATKVFLGAEDVSTAIRSPEMDMLSSRISAVKEVREAMTLLQREMAGRTDLVAEGRDMGTVVFPGADFKFFVTASPEARAERRYRERVGRGEAVSKTEVTRDLLRRDEHDRTRPIAPLRPAEDAVVVDTTDLSPAQVVERMIALIKEGRRP